MRAADLLNLAVAKLESEQSQPCKTDKGIRTPFLKHLFINHLKKYTDDARMMNKRGRRSDQTVLKVGEPERKKAKNMEGEREGNSDKQVIYLFSVYEQTDEAMEQD